MDFEKMKKEWLEWKRDFERTAFEERTAGKINLAVKVITAGNIVQVQTFERVNRNAPKIKRIDGITWVNTETGEVYRPEVKESRKASLRASMSNLRDIINANTENPQNVRWVTLTYAENMTDTKRLYHDFKNFWLRICFYCEKQGYGKPEYITAVEPQERGAWHCHVLMIWQSKAPFIPNSDLAKVWKHGFVKIVDVTDCDNLGAYLSAYLSDTLDTKTKASKKGARFYLYPPGMKFYRLSQGIKKPTYEWTSDRKAHEAVKGLRKTYETVKTIQIDEAKSTIVYEHYNKLPPKERNKK